MSEPFMYKIKDEHDAYKINMSNVIKTSYVQIKMIFETYIIGNSVFIKQ